MIRQYFIKPPCLSGEIEKIKKKNTLVNGTIGNIFSNKYTVLILWARKKQMINTDFQITECSALYKGKPLPLANPLKNGRRYLVKFQENSMNVFIFGTI